MNYLDKNHPSAYYKWPLTNLAAYGYDFPNFPEGVEVVDLASLIPSSISQPFSEPIIPQVEGVVEGGNPVGEVIGDEVSVGDGERVAPLSRKPRRTAPIEQDAGRADPALGEVSRVSPVGNDVDRVDPVGEDVAANL